jgi:hypothetical protein
MKRLAHQDAAPQQNQKHMPSVGGTMTHARHCAAHVALQRASPAFDSWPGLPLLAATTCSVHDAYSPQHPPQKQQHVKHSSASAVAEAPRPNVSLHVKVMSGMGAAAADDATSNGTFAFNGTIALGERIGPDANIMYGLFPIFFRRGGRDAYASTRIRFGAD